MEPLSLGMWVVVPLSMAFCFAFACVLISFICSCMGCWEGRSCGPLLVPWILQHIFSTNWAGPPLLYLHSIRLSGMLLFSGRRNKCSLVAVHKLRATFVCLPLEMGIIIIIIIILLLLCYKSFCGTSSLDLRAIKIYSFSSWSLSSENYQF